MNGYRVRFTREAVEDFAALPANMDARIRKVIEMRIATHPEAYGAPMRGALAGLWKIRTGDFRIVFELDAARHVVTIWGLQHRAKVYPEMTRRLRRVK